MREIQICYIAWIDTCLQYGEVGEQGAALEPELLMHSVGFLVKEDDKFISIALDKYDHRECYRNVLSIPKVLVRERQDFSKAMQE